jgi:hypothetical protein
LLAGRIPKWPTGADCKSAGLRLHWFESSSYHHSKTPQKTSGLTNVYLGYSIYGRFGSCSFWRLMAFVDFSRTMHGK